MLWIDVALPISIWHPPPSPYNGRHLQYLVINKQAPILPSRALLSSNLCKRRLCLEVLSVPSVKESLVREKQEWKWGMFAKIFLFHKFLNLEYHLQIWLYYVFGRTKNFTEKWRRANKRFHPESSRNQRWRMWSIKRRGNGDEENGYDEERKDAPSSWIWCIDICSWSPNIRIGQVEVLFSR